MQREKGYLNVNVNAEELYEKHEPIGGVVLEALQFHQLEKKYG